MLYISCSQILKNIAFSKTAISLILEVYKDIREVKNNNSFNNDVQYIDIFTSMQSL